MIYEETNEHGLGMESIHVQKRKEKECAKLKSKQKLRGSGKENGGAQGEAQMIKGENPEHLKMSCTSSKFGPTKEGHRIHHVVSGNQKDTKPNVIVQHPSHSEKLESIHTVGVSEQRKNNNSRKPASDVSQVPRMNAVGMLVNSKREGTSQEGTDLNTEENALEGCGTNERGDPPDK